MGKLRKRITATTNAGVLGASCPLPPGLGLQPRIYYKLRSALWQRSNLSWHPISEEFAALSPSSRQNLFQLISQLYLCREKKVLVPHVLTRSGFCNIPEWRTVEEQTVKTHGLMPVASLGAEDLDPDSIDPPA
ncbi:hypothetical protein Y1Q_0007354 [Alligator mississippiensis]|uniref:Uncharacterized protein n=1 Tax=Alligator mississippiensis TaxID=8496 RepID=A0A151P8I8_ALLMI|nr:hypothetical protein Y1Q_0007354 [Alligator mississippiensis]